MQVFDNSPKVNVSPNTKTNSSYRGDVYLMKTVLMRMMNCFCGVADRRKAFSLISSQDHCQRSSPLRISDTQRVGLEPPQNLKLRLS